MEMLQKDKLEFYSVYRKILTTQVNQKILPIEKAKIFCDEATKVALNSSEENAGKFF